MPRMTPKSLAILLILAALPATASAQPNIFVGPGSTVPGDVDRGEGVLLYGAGMYNYYSAMAGSINADTYMRLNEYIYQSLQKMETDRQDRVRAYQKRRSFDYNAIQERKLNAPERKDLESGDALNHRLRLLLDPQVFGGSVLQSSPVPISIDDVRAIPFTFPSGGATVSIRRLSDTKRWPIGLRGQEFDYAQKIYARAIDGAFEEILVSKLTHASIARIEQAIEGLQRELDRQYPRKDDKDYGFANEYLIKLRRAKEDLRKPYVEQIIRELDKYSGTTVDELIGFMARNKLQFGTPELGDELSRYPRIFQKLILQHDLVKGNVRAPAGRD